MPNTWKYKWGDSMENLKITISNNNAKMGAIPSISFPPVITCRCNAPCVRKCYAAKICRLRESVKNSYVHNLDVYKKNPVIFWQQVKAAACISGYFRYFVSGDLPDAKFFADAVKLAKDLKTTKFLMFTKKFEIVNAYLQQGGKIPKNLIIIYSQWGNFRCENPFNLPESEIIFKGEKPLEKWLVCGGNCASCICKGIGCWQLKKGDTIAFYEH